MRLDSPQNPSQSIPLATFSSIPLLFIGFVVVVQELPVDLVLAIACGDY